MSKILTAFIVVLRIFSIVSACFADEPEAAHNSWNQWRGPSRDGQFKGARWPDNLSETALVQEWRVDLPPSYSGPIVSPTTVFVTGTEDKKKEVVLAFDRKTGQQQWRTAWDGSMTVPFFAASNGSWIRSTPAFDGNHLFVAGMRDVLMCLDQKSGSEVWHVDFVQEFGTPLPSFGFVSSPLVDGESVYVQAGASFVRLEKKTGKVVWRSLKEEGGMSGSAFSSPVIATLGGIRQLVVQTREILAGIDPQNGQVLWEQKVPSFRGMNILTPVIFEGGVFTSTYQNKSWLFRIENSNGKLSVHEQWNEKSQGYMSTPVVIDGYAYMHLQNQRFTCINLKTGERTWTSTPYGKYVSLIAQQNRILGLDQTGKLLLLKANPNHFELLDERKICEQETWAHLAATDNTLFVRELTGLMAFRWRDPD